MIIKALLLISTTNYTPKHHKIRNYQKAKGKSQSKEMSESGWGGNSKPSSGRRRYSSRERKISSSQQEDGAEGAAEEAQAVIILL